VIGIALLCLTSACGREAGERAYRLGQNYLQQGRQAAALRCFLAATQYGKRCAAEAHLESAELYLTWEKDPLAAIHHYRQYLRLMPNDRQAALVRQRIETAEKAFLAQIPLLRRSSRETQGDLLRTIRLLQEENAKLKQRMAVVDAAQRSQREGENRPAAPIADAPPASSGRTHTVAKGDTLSSISQRMYGTAGRWKEIYEANRQELQSPARLPIGQRLVIP
jgi:tetratricopeptide (TPR) repeat protein